MDVLSGQMSVLKNHPRAAPLIQEMWDHEREHLKKFEELLITYNVKPTIFVPLWKAAGFTLGMSPSITAIHGKSTDIIVIRGRLCHAR